MTWDRSMARTSTARGSSLTAWRRATRCRSAVQADLPRARMAAKAPQAGVDELDVEQLAEAAGGRSRAAREGGDGTARQKSLTIGAVCKALAQEFPDISISKIRYLEDQKLLTPRRTPGGYRLYTQGDVARLRTILRMQRDEFLPLRVIRQELAAGRSGDATPAQAPGE